MDAASTAGSLSTSQPTPFLPAPLLSPETWPHLDHQRQHQRPASSGLAVRKNPWVKLRGPSWISEMPQAQASAPTELCRIIATTPVMTAHTHRCVPYSAAHPEVPPSESLPLRQLAAAGHLPRPSCLPSTEPVPRPRSARTPGHHSRADPRAVPGHCSSALSCDSSHLPWHLPSPSSCQPCHHTSTFHQSPWTPPPPTHSALVLLAVPGPSPVSPRPSLAEPA